MKKGKNMKTKNLVSSSQSILNPNNSTIKFASFICEDVCRLKKIIKNMKKEGEVERE